MFLGAETIRPLLRQLAPEAVVEDRPRFSRLDYSGYRKVTRLPPRSAVVAFSAGEVYRLAELVRRQRGGTAVVLGALSPRARNAQVGMYQAGEVDYLVATDAIGMGLNMDVRHVAFSALEQIRRAADAQAGGGRGRPDRRARRTARRRRHIRRHRRAASDGRAHRRAGRGPPLRAPANRLLAQ